MRPGDGGRKGVGRGEGRRDDDDNVIVVRYVNAERILIVDSMSLC